MLPYWRLQLVYALASGVLAALAWWLAGRRWRGAGPGPRPARLRWLAAGALTLLPLGVWWYAARALDEPHTTFQFKPISWAFYALCLWLPLLAAADQLRARARPRDLLLLAGAAFAVLAGLDMMLVEPNRLITVEHRIEFSAWPEDAPPLRLVHVSDLQTVGRCARDAEAARRIEALDPDLIVVTGDYAAGPFDDPEPAIAAARSFLSALHAQLGVIVVAGHSENDATRARIFAGLDLIELRNQTREFDLGWSRTLRVFGVPARGTDLDALQPSSAPGTVTVVASHVPDLSADLDGRGVDLHLAGHTHGGQIAIPGCGPPLILSALPRRYARGLHPFGDHLLHVNPGLGMEGNFAPRVRFLCPPEISVLTLAGSGPPTNERP